MTRRDRIKNAEIRKILEIEKINKAIENKQGQWLEYLTRMRRKIQGKKKWETKLEKGRREDQKRRSNK